LLNEQGEPNPDYYVADQLHLSPAAYAVWNKALAPHLAR
jgi:lysophospholipase L1-like esterase